MTQGFLTFKPLRSITARLEFVARACASCLSPTSSVTSLFFERLRLSIPLLCASSLAKSTKPESEKAFLLISRTLSVLLSARKPLNAEIPALLILLKLKHSSCRAEFFLRASTNAYRPPSLMKFEAKLRVRRELLTYKASAKAINPSAAI